MTARTQLATLDSWFFNDGASNYGNGLGGRMIVGHTAFGTLTGTNRCAMRFPRGNLFDGIPNAAAITAFDIKLRVKGGCAGIGGSVRFFLERATTALAENTEAVDCEVNTNGADKSKKWPGPDRNAIDRASYSGSPAADQWITVPALALGRSWFTAGWSELVLVAIAANADLSDYDESTSSRRVAFYAGTGSPRAGSIPYAEVEFGANQPPAKPTVSVSYPGSIGQFTATGSYDDPDGDTSPKFEALFTPDAT